MKHCITIRIIDSRKAAVTEIRNFLNNVPENTAILLTSQIENNLDKEAKIMLDGLSKEDAKNIFLEHLTEDIRQSKDLSEIFQQTLILLKAIHWLLN